MICFPNAKINLGLHIVSKRPDGYHNIETVFYPIPLCDALEIVPSETGETTFSQTGISIDGSPNDNLVMKAFHLLKNDFDLPEIAVFLRKQIPFGAGLGGGSADAAFMLGLLNDFAGLGLSVEQMEEYAGRLGADCPFFVRNKPVFAEGVGDIFTPVDVSLKGYYLVLVKPDIHVSTKEAYAGIAPRQPLSRLTETIHLPVEEWKNRLVNDFEEGIFARYPAIGGIKQSLYDQGAIYASMSGSGSSVFGIFEKPPIFREKNGEKMKFFQRLLPNIFYSDIFLT
ncbi:MAG: 4-(cytidine 5'-diphospho)-2-C-methyl-D-erythritol kinase [Dysgonamonadaceae bacterium]|jgi:4-diphosphocytidyl-2-C-methyl-D-erythritol kinase|nr:4-(cytidine 5'-diphospho)-2-C-methyl-D-erythritol kinase [Dysgonamonadaceae bacterium]